jgi:hypothetical protein
MIVRRITTPPDALPRAQPYTYRRIVRISTRSVGFVHGNVRAVEFVHENVLAVDCVHESVRAVSQRKYKA